MEIPVEANFGAVLDAAPDAMLVVDQPAALCWPTCKASSYSAIPAAELVGQKIEVLVPPRFRAKHPGHRSGYFSGDPHVRPMGAGLYSPRSAQGWYRVPGRDQLEPGGDSQGPMVISAVRDVTARKGAEDKFRALLESAPDAMVIVDPRREDRTG